MNVTEDKFKDRQLHSEGHLHMVSAEQKEYAEASACSRIAENTNIITDLQTTGLLEEILRSDNLNTAYKKVKSNYNNYYHYNTKCAKIQAKRVENQAIAGMNLVFSSFMCYNVCKDSFNGIFDSRKRGNYGHQL